MFLSGYQLEILRPDCNPSFQSIHCIAHLDRDISEVLPYLHSELGGFSYVTEPPSVTFRVYGRLITVYPDRIAVNALKDRAEAEQVIEWLKSEINRCWDNRKNIEPSTTNKKNPQVIRILENLPLTNCTDCGQPTCMLLAHLIAQGAKDPTACPHIKETKQKKLLDYLSNFAHPSDRAHLVG